MSTFIRTEVYISTICRFGAQETTYFLSMLKTVVLLLLCVKHDIFNRILWWIECSKGTAFF